MLTLEWKEKRKKWRCVFVQDDRGGSTHYLMVHMLTLAVFLDSVLAIFKRDHL